MWIRANKECNFLKGLSESDMRTNAYLITSRKKDDPTKIDKDKDIIYGAISDVDQIDTILKQFSALEYTRLYIHINGTNLKDYHAENIRRSADFLQGKSKVKMNPFNLTNSILTKSENKYQKLFLLDIDMIEPIAGTFIDQAFIEKAILKLFSKDFSSVPDLVDSYLTKTGMHMLFTKFDTMLFEKKWADLKDDGVTIEVKHNAYSLIAYTDELS